MHKYKVKGCGWIKLAQDTAQLQDLMTVVAHLFIQ
jgi:hypothetical protein